MPLKDAVRRPAGIDGDEVHEILLLVSAIDQETARLSGLLGLELHATLNN